MLRDSAPLIYMSSGIATKLHRWGPLGLNKPDRSITKKRFGHLNRLPEKTLEHTFVTICIYSGEQGWLKFRQWMSSSESTQKKRKGVAYIASQTITWSTLPISSHSKNQMVPMPPSGVRLHWAIAIFKCMVQMVKMPPGGVKLHEAIAIFKCMVQLVIMPPGGVR